MHLFLADAMHATWSHGVWHVPSPAHRQMRCARMPCSPPALLLDHAYRYWQVLDRIGHPELQPDLQAFDDLLTRSGVPKKTGSKQHRKQSSHAPRGPGTGALAHAAAAHARTNLLPARQRVAREWAVAAGVLPVAEPDSVTTRPTSPPKPGTQKLGQPLDTAASFYHKPKEVAADAGRNPSPIHHRLEVTRQPAVGGLPHPSHLQQPRWVTEAASQHQGEGAPGTQMDELKQAGNTFPQVDPAIVEEEQQGEEEGAACSPIPPSPHHMLSFSHQALQAKQGEQGEVAQDQGLILDQLLMAHGVSVASTCSIGAGAGRATGELGVAGQMVPPTPVPWPGAGAGVQVGGKPPHVSSRTTRDSQQAAAGLPCPRSAAGPHGDVPRLQLLPPSLVPLQQQQQQGQGPAISRQGSRPQVSVQAQQQPGAGAASQPWARPGSASGAVQRTSSSALPLQAQSSSLRVGSAQGEGQGHGGRRTRSGKAAESPRSRFLSIQTRLDRMASPTELTPAGAAEKE